ncbi:MAG: DUF1343 domain-containing protein [Spirochaetes bacterium]|nr:DUF1343 domain-containing protein [Spirochaetota bacterium]
MAISGLEVLLTDIERYKHRNIGLLCNHTSVTSDLEYSWDALQKAGMNIVRIFTPEHGLFAVEQDQKAVHETACGNIEIVSLYGNNATTLYPRVEALQGIDLVMCDIQDIGTRYYTYLNTMAYFLHTIRDCDIEFVVLDRPNPLGGVQIEGPLLNHNFTSFVGVFDCPVRHGLTCGEIAMMYHKRKQINCGLTVIPMKGWRRDCYYDDVGIPWIPPSPNMPTIETAIVYPGSCLLEGTNISEGRGTTTPFQIVGAPFVDKNEFAKTLNALHLPGVYFRPVEFRPTFHKYVGELCQGVFIHVLDRKKFRPFLTGIALVKTLYDLYGERVEFLHGVYEFTSLHPAFDLLCGTDAIRHSILKHESLQNIAKLWEADEREWDNERKEWWLY